jgi:hypothetical protein
LQPNDVASEAEWKRFMPTTTATTTTTTTTTTRANEGNENGKLSQTFKCVNFINVLHVPFSNESILGSFSLVTFWL